MSASVEVAFLRKVFQRRPLTANQLGVLAVLLTHRDGGIGYRDLAEAVTEGNAARLNAQLMGFEKRILGTEGRPPDASLALVIADTGEEEARVLQLQARAKEALEALPGARDVLALSPALIRQRFPRGWRPITDEALASLREEAPELVCWKVEIADQWERFFREKIVGLTPQPDPGDLRAVDGARELLAREPSLGRPEAVGLLHFREAARGEIVLAVSDNEAILGVGLLQGPYEYHQQRPRHRHRRKVLWLVSEKLHLESSIFRPEMVTPTQNWPWIRAAYQAAFPYLAATLNRLEAMGQGATGYTEGGSYIVPELSSGRVGEREPFPLVRATEGLFLPTSQFEELAEVLRKRKNVILQGPPGTGKTLIARRLGYALAGYRDPQYFELVQFHPSYAYEDFILGIRPDEEGKFQLRRGVFYRFCERARRDPGQPYTFLIDEINRGNLASIFGELLLLLEPDKRGPDYAVSLTYGKEDERFYLPENVHLIGTMNTADRSLAGVDYALRRRFAFARLDPMYNDVFRGWVVRHGIPNDWADQLIDRVAALNERIREDDNLGPGFELGHSFFTPTEQVKDPALWLRRILQLNVRPLLEAYYFDQPHIAEAEVAALGEGLAKFDK